MGRDGRHAPRPRPECLRPLLPAAHHSLKLPGPGADTWVPRPGLHAQPLAAAGADGAKTGTPSSMEAVGAPAPPHPRLHTSWSRRRETGTSASVEAVGAPAPPNHNYTRGQEGESLWGNEGLLEGRLAAEEPQTHKCLLQVLLLKPRREGGSFSR